VIGSIGGNGVFNAIYVNVYDDRFVFVMFTNVAEFAAEDVFQMLRERILGLLNGTDGLGTSLPRRGDSR
jgi:hypothetical protein